MAFKLNKKSNTFLIPTEHKFIPKVCVILRSKNKQRNTKLQ